MSWRSTGCAQFARRRSAPALPPSIHLDIVTDRAEVIRASLEDVEMTLAITIALVVMVIFIFLRRLGDHHPGDHHPAVAARHAGRAGTPATTRSTICR
jgi:hypothetical protein